MSHDTGKVRYVAEEVSLAVGQAKTGRTFYLWANATERPKPGRTMPRRLELLLPQGAYATRLADARDSVVQVQDGRVTS